MLAFMLHGRASVRIVSWSYGFCPYSSCRLVFQSLTVAGVKLPLAEYIGRAICLELLSAQEFLREINWHNGHAEDRMKNHKQQTNH